MRPGLLGAWNTESLLFGMSSGSHRDRIRLLWSVGSGTRILLLLYIRDLVSPGLVSFMCFVCFPWRSIESTREQECSA